MKTTKKKTDKTVWLVRFMYIILAILMGGGSVATLLYYIIGG